MRITRIIAVAALWSMSGVAALAQGPAELPPSSFTGSQYVDSRGCVFNRADINGSVTWVPRVTRDRQLVCGFQPTLAAQASAAPSPRQQAAPATGAAPRAAAPRQQSAARPAPAQPRVVPRHVYENRQNAQTAVVPSGYRSVWEDDRLNPRRAERGAAPAVVRPPELPPGFRVAWDDDRLNRNRGGGQAGDAQTARIWTEDLPRRLISVPYTGEILRLSPENEVSELARSPRAARQSAAADRR